jgi:ribosomal protein S18 acetylase RimI-like enzyme
MVVNMKILYQNDFTQLKDIRAVNLNKLDAAKLAVCLNHWSEDDSWGGSFSNVEWTTERVFEDWFNLKYIEQFIVDKDSKIQGYISLDHHFSDEDATYVPTLGVIPSAQRTGYGKALLFSALKRTIEMGKRRLDLETWAGNLRSVPVYKKTGFFWRKNTSVLMENYLPAVLSTPLFEEFFSKNDFYDSREIEVTQMQDDFKHETMQAYFYRFVEDKNNALTVFVDCHAKELSGFSYLLNGENLSVQLIPNQNEIFVGIDKTTAALKIKNNWAVPLEIKGKLNPFKGIKDITPKQINLTIQPGDELSIDITATIDKDVETYTPAQKPEDRTDSRFTILLDINQKSCMLGCGWVPKDPIQLNILQRSADFGKYQEELSLPIGFRNVTAKPMIGELTIAGEGLTEPHIVDFNLDANCATETSVIIQKPSTPTSEAWKWDLEFKIKNESDLQTLQRISTHISCFTKSGVAAYLNSKPIKECVIENEYLSFRFEYGSKDSDDLFSIFVKELDKEISFQALGIFIGIPYPEESSEFWRIECPYEIIKRKNGITLKQEFISTTEKPGLKVIRFIELDAGKRYLTTYYDLINTNTEKDQIIHNVSVSNYIWNLHKFFSGYYILPIYINSNPVFLNINDPEFIDKDDFPNNAEDFAESWLAHESDNDQGLGFGLIWNSNEVKKIYFGFDWVSNNIEYLTNDLKPEETVRTGNYTLVIGQPAARLTRRIWLKEFNGKEVLNKGRDACAYSQRLLDFRCGEKLLIPGLDQNLLPVITLMDVERDNIELEVIYNAKRETSLDIEIEIASKFWENPQNQTFKLENGKRNISFLPIENEIKTRFSQPILVDGKITLPYNIRRDTRIVVPYNSKSEVNLEKKGNYWSFSNKYLNFKVSNTHGASLFSAQIENYDDELFFSRFPNKNSYVWFKKFVGGLHPLIGVPGVWQNKEFFNNMWSEPVLIEKNGWYGLQFALSSAENDFRLNNISYLMTYYTRPDCAMIWASLEMTNNSKMTNYMDSNINLYLQPIEFIHFPWNNELFTGVKTSQRKKVQTESPNNWVIADWGTNKLKALFISTNPGITISGYYANANNYTELQSSATFTLKPGATKRHDIALIFSNDLNVLKTFRQKQHVVRL